eukprot:TRINITY_DN560_c0_g1_i1.p1 TRINITY_DN560_c0_g1~~TRINITY_DN560_c0_g1_i1.p1  ORF type:complete len:484 (+),score=99.08 TRINITY_DN560_c0_g1_i1:150-1601(+)
MGKERTMPCYSQIIRKICHPNVVFSLCYGLLLVVNLIFLTQEDLSKFAYLKPTAAANANKDGVAVMLLDSRNESMSQISSEIKLIQPLGNLPELEQKHGVLWSGPQTAKVWIRMDLLAEVPDRAFPFAISCRHESEAVAFQLLSKIQTEGTCNFVNEVVPPEPCVFIKAQDCANCSEFKFCSPVIIPEAHSRTIPKPQNLSVCAIFKSQSKDLPEWLSYHILQGVEHFYLYDNTSPDREELAAALAPYVEAGYVTYVYWPDKDSSWGFQTSAINDCVMRFGVSRYTAVLDIDEFLLAGDDATSVIAADRVHQIFTENPRLLSLGVPWRVFGTSGYESSPDELVIGAYTKRMVDLSPPDADGSRHWYTYFREYDQRVVMGQKSVFKTDEFVSSHRHPHFFQMSNPRRSSFLPVPVSDLRINHYHCKSWEDWIRRYRRRNPTANPAVSKDEFYRVMGPYEVEEDTTLVPLYKVVEEHIRKTQALA